MARQLGYGGGVAVRRRVNVGRGVALVLQARRQKLVDSECGCGGGRHASVAPSVAVMTAAGTSKVEARRRAREATRRANEARAAREKANIENAANYMVAKARLAEIDAWETERLAAVTELVRAEATKRRAGTRAAAGAAIRLLRESGETLTTIAELTGDGLGEVRAMLRHAPKIEKRTARKGSHALGGFGVVGPSEGPGGGATDNPEAASA
ncbi:hypothetical protein [Mycolicibacterium bacteremicum]|uniref:Translation initiation factor IF-2 n=2 Tax=Actinomycetota TaxID=201174 RepID=A0AAV2WLM8_MYCNE|nr:hypothetical protein [Mycolicibacterium bacteremicum]CDQ44883.1 hypothetical protein BN1047_02763 [Mycolicibacterium neoaurum]